MDVASEPEGRCGGAVDRCERCDADDVSCVDGLRSPGGGGGSRPSWSADDRPTASEIEPELAAAAAAGTVAVWLRTRRRRMAAEAVSLAEPLSAPSPPASGDEKSNPLWPARLTARGETMRAR
jgi:hypothetical protein